MKQVFFVSNNINKRVQGSQRSPRIVDLAPIRMANRQKVKPSDIVTWVRVFLLVFLYFLSKINYIFSLRINASPFQSEMSYQQNNQQQQHANNHHQQQQQPDSDDWKSDAFRTRVRNQIHQYLQERDSKTRTIFCRMLFAGLFIWARGKMVEWS